MKVSAVLKMPKSVKKLMPFAQSVVTAMSENASFPSPTPALATVSADITAPVVAKVGTGGTDGRILMIAK
jgi:hypothetical protein